MIGTTMEERTGVMEESRKRQRKNAKRGVKLLDEKKPNWREQITRHLSMNLCSECVIGQVFNIDQGDMGFKQFQDALLELGISNSIEDAEKYGFDIENPDVDSYGDLEDIWEEFIRGNSN